MFSKFGGGYGIHSLFDVKVYGIINMHHLLVVTAKSVFFGNSINVLVTQANKHPSKIHSDTVAANVYCPRVIWNYVTETPRECDKSR